MPVRTVVLATPTVPLLVPARVFDGFAWCAGEDLEWRAAAWDETTRLDGSDPARMVFVLRRTVDWLPREVANVHALGLGLGDDTWALAPYAIDDATDGLYERRVPPRDLLWLAADNLNALFWGLHDWAHFHNHGPFEERAYNELQCDASALAWLWLNRARIPLGEARWEALREDAVALARARFAEEKVEFDQRVLAAERLRALVGG